MNSWTQQDTRYAAAASAALTLVVVLIAFTFGLGPNPLRALVGRPAASLNLPPISAQQGQDTAAGSASASNPGQVLGIFLTNDAADSSATTSRPPIKAVDSTAPGVDIATPNGAIVVVVAGHTTSGTVSDAGGVDNVTVVYESATGGLAMYRADLSCNSNATACTWMAGSPGTLGNFKVRARAVDASGNTAESTVKQITVVSPQPPNPLTSASRFGGFAEAVGSAMQSTSGLGAEVGGAVLEAAGSLLR